MNYLGIDPGLTGGLGVLDAKGNILLAEAMPVEPSFLPKRNMVSGRQLAALGLEQIQTPGGGMVVANPGWAFRLMTMITLMSGTAFIMWLGEQISERGIGNGISLIIVAGIVASLPSAIVTTFSYVRQGELGPLVLLLLAALMVVTIGAIIFVERGQRRIPVQYAKRVVGRRMYGGQSTHLPLKLNTAGVIPPIFASSLLIFPATIAQFVQNPAFQTVADYRMRSKRRTVWNAMCAIQSR